MKKIFTKLLVAVALFSTTGLGIIANEANPNSSTNGLVFRHTLLNDNGSWHYLIDGKAIALHNNGFIKTQGTGLKNHFFTLYVRGTRGENLVHADAHNGKEGIAYIRYLDRHTHNTSGALMS